jgi:hypothetical protein
MSNLFTLTPNIGLQVPNPNAPNWQASINYDLNLLDSLFAGLVTLANFVAETPAGAVPGVVFTLSQTPVVVLAVFQNGLFQRPGGLDYTLTGSTVTMNAALSSGDTIYAIYFK